MDPLLTLVAARTRHGAQKAAERFALTVKPGHTYYSVVDNHAKYPGAPTQIAMEWTFSKPGRWIGQEARCGHMTAKGAWLGYGPLHERRPSNKGGLIPTLAELRDRPGLPVDRMHDSLLANLTPAGV